jgi:hypothetical protein
MARVAGGTGVILPPAFSPGWCYEPRLIAPAETKGRGQLLPNGAVGSPL